MPNALGKEHPMSNDTDVEMVSRIEQYIAKYDCGVDVVSFGFFDCLLHDIDLNFPGVSYRTFLLAYKRAREAYKRARERERREIGNRDRTDDDAAWDALWGVERPEVER
jgi:hypothetical protein